MRKWTEKQNRKKKKRRRSQASPLCLTWTCSSTPWQRRLWSIPYFSQRGHRHWPEPQQCARLCTQQQSSPPPQCMCKSAHSWSALILTHRERFTPKATTISPQLFSYPAQKGDHSVLWILSSWLLILYGGLQCTWAFRTDKTFPCY